MKKSLLILSLVTSSVLAQTTMCFKEQHNSLSNIEDIQLDGGKCMNKYSLNDMKKRNWEVSDIKITPKNSKYDFIYILKKIKIEKENISQEEIKATVIAQINKTNERIKKDNAITLQMDEIEEGKKIYLRNCKLCHGTKGEIETYDTSKALNTLSLEDMQFAINKYTFDDEYGDINASIMRPYASSINSENTKKVYEYLKSINK
jgi:cytochrome c553